MKQLAIKILPNRYAKYEILTDMDVQQKIGKYINSDKRLILMYLDSGREITKKMINKMDTSRGGLIKLFFDSFVYDNHLEQIRDKYPEREYPFINYLGDSGNDLPGELDRIRIKYSTHLLIRG